MRNASSARKRQKYQWDFVRLGPSLLLHFQEREQLAHVDDAKKCAKLSALNVREEGRKVEI